MIQRLKRTAKPTQWKLPSTKRLVLVVEDDDHIREMYADLLTFSGFSVVEASNGREAVVAGSTLRPDLIVMDLALPFMDGIDAMRTLKSDPRTSLIPVIAVTGFSPEHYRQRASAAGCDVFLTKPCSPELLDEVHRLLGLA
jgi:CheY-like chemotaxis protein